MRSLFVFLSLLILSTGTLSLVPTASVEAGIIPCGLSTPDPDIPGGGTERCTLCHLIVGINQIIIYLRNILSAIAIAVIVAMAFVYLTSGGNESRMTFAKGGMIAALIGLCIVLLAWVTVNFILTLPIFNTSTNLIRTGWNTVQCQTSSLSAGATTPMVPGGGGGNAGGGAGGGGDTSAVTLPRDDSGNVIVTPLLPSPTGLSVTVPTTTTTLITWNAIPEATGYELERCIGQTCTLFTPLVTLTGTSFTDTGLSSGTDYTYHVRAITPTGVSNWSNAVGVMTPGTPGNGGGNPGLPSNTACVGPGTPEYLLGKRWVSNWTSPEGIPIRSEVAFYDANTLTLTVNCRYSTLGRGNDLAPMLTVPIRNVTASSFEITTSAERTLTNNQGLLCRAQTVAGSAPYVPSSETAMSLFGLNFTGTCQSGSGDGSGDPGGGGGGGGTIRLPGTCSVGSFVPNVSVGTGLNASLTPGQYGGAVGTGNVNYSGPQVVYVNVPAGRLVSIPFVRAPGQSTWVDLASFGGSSIVGQRAQISISTTPGGAANANCVSQLGVFQPRILTDSTHCNVPSSGYINVATTGSCAGGSVACIFMVRQVGGVVMTGTGTGGSCSAGNTTTSPPVSTTPPPFPWTIQGQTFNSLSSAQAAFPNMGIVINGVAVTSGIVIGNVYGTAP